MRSRTTNLSDVRVTYARVPGSAFFYLAVAVKTQICKENLIPKTVYHNFAGCVTREPSQTNFHVLAGSWNE